MLSVFSELSVGSFSWVIVVKMVSMKTVLNAGNKIYSYKRQEINSYRR